MQHYILNYTIILQLYNKKEYFMRKFIPVAFVTLTVLFVIISNIIWLKIDTLPQRWDESIHLDAATKFAEKLAVSPLKFLPSFVTQETYYPPLIPFLGSLTSVFGLSADNITMTMLLFHSLLIVFTFLYTRIKLDTLSAFAASALVFSFPVIYSQGHYFMFDVPLTTLFIIYLYVHHKSEYFKNRRTSAVLGFIFGLGMLIKWTFIFFIIAPMVIDIINMKKDKTTFQNFLIFLGVVALTAGPWYFWNFLGQSFFPYFFTKRFDLYPSLCCLNRASGS